MQNDYAQLLLDIQKKSSITVKKSRDLRFLKEDMSIEANTVTLLKKQNLTTLKVKLSLKLLRKAKTTKNLVRILKKKVMIGKIQVPSKFLLHQGTVEFHWNFTNVSKI